MHIQYRIQCWKPNQKQFFYTLWHFDADFNYISTIGLFLYVTKTLNLSFFHICYCLKEDFVISRFFVINKSDQSKPLPESGQWVNMNKRQKATVVIPIVRRGPRNTFFRNNGGQHSRRGWFKSWVICAVKYKNFHSSLLYLPWAENFT